MRVPVTARPRFRAWVVAAAAVAAACGGPAEPLMFTVSPSSISLKVGESVQLQVAIQDANGKPVTNRPITYTSQNPAVATVSAGGLVTAVSSGTTTITLAAEAVAGSVPVTVTPTATGTWSGTLTIEGFTLAFSMRLVEAADGSISGTGSFSLDAATLPLTFTGTHDHPAITLTIRVANDPQVEPARFAGQFIGDNTITGQLFDSGFTGETVTVTRQPAVSARVVESAPRGTRRAANSVDLATLVRSMR